MIRKERVPLVRHVRLLLYRWLARSALENLDGRMNEQTNLFVYGAPGLLHLAPRRVPTL